MKGLALREIKAGEEITDNYGNYLGFLIEWVRDLMMKHCSSRLNVEKVLPDYGQ